MLEDSECHRVVRFSVQLCGLCGEKSSGLFQILDLVAEDSGAFEFERVGGFEHFLFELVNHFVNIVFNPIFSHSGFELLPSQVLLLWVHL